MDSHLRSSRPDIFAAGDVARLQEDGSGRARQDVLWPAAIASGAVAGANMAGGDVRYRPGPPFNVMRLGGLWVCVIGQVGGRAAFAGDGRLAARLQ